MPTLPIVFASLALRSLASRRLAADVFSPLAFLEIFGKVAIQTHRASPTSRLHFGLLSMFICCFHCQLPAMLLIMKFCF